MTFLETIKGLFTSSGTKLVAESELGRERTYTVLDFSMNQMIKDSLNETLYVQNSDYRSKSVGKNGGNKLNDKIIINHLENNRGLGNKEEENIIEYEFKELELIKKELIEYYRKIGVVIDEKLLDELDIVGILSKNPLYAGSFNGLRIYMGVPYYESRREEQRKRCLAHEIIHFIALKIKEYNYILDESKKNVKTIDFKFSTGFEFLKKGYGGFINEAFTDVSAISAVGLSSPETLRFDESGYLINILAIDILIKEISKDSDISYNDLLIYFIRGNAMGDTGVLKVITHALGKDFTNELINLSNFSYKECNELFAKYGLKTFNFNKSRLEIYSDLSVEMQNHLMGV